MILIYSHTAKIDGAPLSIIEVSKLLKKRNEKVVFILPSNGPLEEIISENGFETIILSHPLWSCQSKQEFKNQYKYFKYLIVMLLRFHWELIKCLPIHYKTIRNLKPNLIIVNTSVAPTGLFISKLLRIRSVLWVREAILNKEGWPLNIILPIFIVGMIYKIPHLILGPSKYIQEHFVNLFPNLNFQVISNIVPIINSNRSEKLLMKRVGLVGTILPRKGQLEFCKELLNLSSDLQIQIWGEGSGVYYDELFQLSKSYPKRIQIFGFSRNLDDIFNSFDIYINLGWNETFGRTTIEAMSAGKLVFGRKSGATMELIEHGVNGFLIEDTSEITTILNSHRLEELDSIRLRGQQFSEKFLPERIENELFNLLDSINE